MGQWLRSAASPRLRNKLPRAAAIAAFFIPFLIWPVGAQQPDPGLQDRLKGLSLDQLGNIEVTTTTKEPVTVTRTPAAVYVITQDDIRRSGATSIPEALRLAPGVEVARIDSVKWAIGIRGFQSRLSRDVLVLIDGRSVYSPLFHGVYWEVQDTLLEDIERIEVIRGPGGTIWGANAVDGVINIITKSSKNTHGALVSAGGGSVDQGFLDFRYGGGNDKDFDYRFYAKGFDRSPEYHYDDRNFDDFRRAQGGFRTDWNVTKRDSLTIQGDLYDGVDGESAKITVVSPPSAYVLDQNGALSGGNLLAHWKRDLGGGSDLQIETYYDRVNRRQPNQAEYRNTFDVDVIHHWAFSDRQNIIWGFGARLSLGELPEVVPTYVFNPNSRVDQLYSLFAQDEIQLVPGRLALTAGSKILHSSYTGFDAEPSVRLLWTPSTHQSFWTAVTRAVRTPSDIEDTLTTTTPVSTNPPTFSQTTGDRIFTSETMLGYEAGFRQLVNPRLSFDLATFYNQYDHLLSLEPGTPFMEDGAIIDPFVNRNGIRGTTKGFELLANWKPSTSWRIEGSYAWLDMDLMNKPGSLDATTVSSTEGASPRHDISLKSFIDLSSKFEFNQIVRYVSALPAEQVTAYVTADARVAWHPDRRFEFAVTGQNLLQPHHAEYGGDPGPLVGIKRSVYAAITWRK
jgi:iron complex outermembrane receptor protein